MITFDDLQSLKPGDLLFNKKYNQTVDVKFGPWSNTAFGGIHGDCLYLEYDDGDRSEVGFDYLDLEDLAELEFIPAEQHSRYF